MWLSEHVHVLAWLFITVLYLFFYVLIHKLCGPAYEQSIQIELTNAVKVYNWRNHPRTGELELMIGDTPYSQTMASDSGPLGIGALPSVRGLLTDADSAFVAYNAAMSGEIFRILDGFELSAANRNQMSIDLSVVAPDLALKLSRGKDHSGDKHFQEAPTERDGAKEKQRSQYVLEVPANTIANLRNEFPDERTARGLLAALTGGVVKNIHVDVSVGFTSPDAKSEDAKSDQMIDAVTPTVMAGEAQSASTELCRRFTAFSDTVRDVLFKQAVVARLSKTENCMFRGISQGNFSTGVGEAGGEPTDRDLQACPSLDERRCFHNTLSKLVMGNPGFFWTIGSYRWLEFVLIAGAGVLLRRLTDFGKDYARLLRAGQGISHKASSADLNPYPRWEPRESLRTLVYFVCAPVIAVVIIWLLAWTNLLSVDFAKLGDLSSSATIPLAFLLGYFPDIGPLVLTRVVGGVFGDITDTAARRRKPPAAEAVAVGGPVVGGGSPPSFAAFSARLRAHATRPFRGSGDDST